MTLTITATKKITKELRTVSDRIETRTLPGDEIMVIASRNNVAFSDVSKLAEELGFRPGTAPKVVAEPKHKIKPVADLVKDQITGAGIFKCLEAKGGELQDDDFVVTTYGQLRRQQEALLKWLKELGYKPGEG